MRRSYRVGHWLIEPDLNRMSGGGKELQVEPKVLELLEYLARHPGEVISRERLTKAVWAGTFVSSGALNYAISELRRVLGDDAGNPRFIQTIPRKGYRLVAEVREFETAPVPEASIAVLSFADMSPERDQEYFCDGLAEEIITILSWVPALRVVARTSSFAYKGKAEDVRTIGRALGVATVLEGSVRKAQGRLRVTAQLVDVGDGYHLWSESYDREIHDIFAIQDEISQSIASTLQLRFSPGARTAAERVPTSDLVAYDYYLRGRQFFYRYNVRGIEFALEMFRKAIAQDRRYARAHAGVADCCSFLYLYGGRRETHREEADAASRTAVELDPALAEAHASRGVALSLRGKYGEAESSFATAVRLNPQLFEAHYFRARVAFTQGKLEEALEHYRRAAEVNPHDYQVPLLSAQVYADLGHAAEAEASRRRGVEIADARLRLSPDDVRARYMGANGLVALGERRRGLEWALEALRLEPDDPMVLYNVGCIQSLAGEYEQALDTLDKAVRSGLTQKDWFEHDSNLDPLRAMPRFDALMRHLDDVLSRSLR